MPLPDTGAAGKEDGVSGGSLLPVCFLKGFDGRLPVLDPGPFPGNSLPELLLWTVVAFGCQEIAQGPGTWCGDPSVTGPETSLPAERLPVVEAEGGHQLPTVVKFQTVIAVTHTVGSGTFPVDRDAPDEVLNLSGILYLKECCPLSVFPLMDSAAAHAQVIRAGKFAMESALPGGVYHTAWDGLAQSLRLFVPGCGGGIEDPDVAEIGELSTIREMLDRSAGSREESELWATGERAQVSHGRGVDLKHP